MTLTIRALKKAQKHFELLTQTILQQQYTFLIDEKLLPTLNTNLPLKLSK